MIQLWQSLVDGMAAVLQWLYGLTVDMHVPSYALAIVLLTILIKIVLSPLYFKQMSSMRKMMHLQPKIKEIQSKHKGKDPREMNEAVMGVYREHGVNPMSGCLPLLIQMPILIALYRALLTFNWGQLHHAGFFWIANMGQKDPYWILPVLAGATTFWQSWLTTPRTSDPAQKSMIYTMPLFFVWITSTVPSGLGLYWIMFNLTGVVQQYIVNRMTPPMVAKEVQEVADDRKNGKDGRGGGGGRPPGTKRGARTGRNRGAGRSN
ncbi:MAG: YidC/Oxa1 family membrane protein insertase [Peptococcaceae bacterium]|nr:YidC/Oxa1 family membrane protein insertase [Peptococcaceae bacterium]